MLKLAQKFVHKQHPHIQSRVIDGSVLLDRRYQIIKDFQSDDDIRICYVSLMTSSEGITLTKATRMYFLDPW